MICAGVPLSPDYIHTCDFGTATLQSAYFTTKAKFALTNYTYQRKTNSIKINLTTEQLYDCNYLAYQNSNFENKWFYCFIINIEYINNTTSEIYFEEDVLQTWMFDYTLNPCFISREHVLDDTIGKHLIPESLEYGDYKYYTSSVYNLPLIPVIVSSVYYNFTTNSVTKLDTANITQTSGPFQAVSFLACSNPQSAGFVISTIQDAGFSDAILSVVMMPAVLFPQTELTYLGSAIKTTDLNFTIPYSNLDGYIPKNNKLYTYPYRYAELYNGVGQNVSVKTELLNNKNNLTVKCILTIEAAPVINAFVANYKGTEIDYQARLSVANFPVCAYTSDTFKTWYAQNSIQFLQQRNSLKDEERYAMQSGLLDAAIGTAKGLMSSNPLTGVAGGIAEAGIQTLKTVNRISFDSEQLVKQQMAQTQIANINSSSGYYSTQSFSDFYFNNTASIHYSLVGITSEFAKKIDNYFSVFGYQINEIKTPNTTGRASWNYIKTIGCDAGGSIPQYAINDINTIFDRGLTIWHNPAWIGNYNLDNSIVGNG